MSDSQVSNTVLAPASDNGQPVRVNEQDLGVTDSLPSTGQADKESENIRKLQSTYDRKLAEQDRAYKAQMQQQNQLIQNLQRDMREARKNAAPDDYTRLQIDLEDVIKERDQYATAYQQAIQAQQAERERIEALRDIADEFGVTVDDLKEATDYKSAAKLAARKQLEREQRKQLNDDDKRERNAVDLGAGAPRTGSSRWEDEYREAQLRGDSPAMARLLRTRGK